MIQRPLGHGISALHFDHIQSTGGGDIPVRMSDKLVSRGGGTESISLRLVLVSKLGLGGGQPTFIAESDRAEAVQEIVC